MDGRIESLFTRKTAMKPPITEIIKIFRRIKGTSGVTVPHKSKPAHNMFKWVIPKRIETRITAIQFFF
jgi:hypothetical protein